MRWGYTLKVLAVGVLGRVVKVCRVAASVTHGSLRDMLSDRPLSSWVLVRFLITIL